jgi:mono/diheme cytochrome c family protein
MRITTLRAASAAAALMAAVTAQAQPALVAKGEAAFTAQRCTMCHAVAGKGNAKGPLDGVAKKYKADALRQWLVDPATMTAQHKATRKPAMRDFSKLPAEEIDALIAYLQTLGK